MSRAGRPLSWAAAGGHEAVVRPMEVQAVRMSWDSDGASTIQATCSFTFRTRQKEVNEL